jgi:hypothetical protein
MRHVLLGHSGRQNVTLDVSASEYAAIVTAAQSLPRVLAIEEKFDILAENYDELEGELDTITRRYVLFGHFGDHRPDDRRQINRRVVNFMSTARLYLDQVDHDLRVLFGADSPQRAAFQESKRAEYDSRFGYEVFEALRNYSQHRGIPVHIITYGRELRTHGGRETMANSLRIALDPAHLEREGGFKASTLEKLKLAGARAELKPLLRDYIAGLRAVHARVRDTLAELEANCERAIQFAVDQMRAQGGKGEEAQVWDAGKMDDQGNFLELEAVYPHFLGLIGGLRAKNARLHDALPQVRSSE